VKIGITCYPTFGGSGIVATEIGVSLARRGHLVHFICSDVPSRLDRFEGNVFFHAVETRGYPLFEHDPYTLALASKMVEVARFEELDVLHVHYAIPHAASAYLARQILGEAAPRIVTTMHGTDTTLIGNDASFLPITRFCILQSDAVTVPSKALADATRENFNLPDSRGIEVIPNFVDEEVFRPAPRRDAQLVAHLFPRAQVRWDHPTARPRVLVHNSNFRPLKRVDDVVRIFAAVRQHVPQALLVLIGDGPERSRVETLLRELGLGEAACFLGKQLAFAEVVAQADVFLMPSAIESFGLAALEALACGVPVVASRTGGVPEVIADGEVGYLCPVGDVAAMAQAVIALLDDQVRHDRMAHAARARVEELFRREPTVTRYEQCYQRLLRAQPE
jgi:N-acetyl-alpha-D-glucosaminyl L-malate synthase BshA